jgi:hypothetical protein
MAKLKNGLFGTFSGKIGNIIGYEYKGQQCIRQMPAKTKKQPSQAMAAQQKKFSYAARFIKTLSPLLNSLPDKKNLSCARSTLAQGMIIRDCLLAEGDGYGINYEQVRLCEGKACPISVSFGTSQAGISFGCSSSLSNAYLLVEAYVLVWLLEYDTWIWKRATFHQGRAEGIISMPGLRTETAAETYIICLFHGEKVSASRYTGRLIIPAAS